MCGIFGYVSRNNINAVPVILDGLKRLEYRGYDSSGIGAITKRGVFLRKKSGRISELEKILSRDIESSVAIGHTRWATHGAPTDKNSHPHFSCNKKIYLVHNGIVENFRELRTKLLKKGHRLTSDTDTEVIAHLVEDFGNNGGNSFEESVRLALKSIVGTYAFTIIHS